MTTNQAVSVRDSQTGDLIKPAIFALCRWLAGIRLLVKRLGSSPIKSILFVGTSEVTVDFLLIIDEIVRDLGTVRASLLVSRSCQAFARRKLAGHRHQMALTGLVRALCFPWELIIFSDHNNTAWFHSAIPKVQCTHGIDAAKRIGPRGNYMYGHNSLDRKGTPLYDVMFVESDYNRNLFIRNNPALKNKMAVVGNLMADELLAKNEERANIRQRLGVQESDRVLLICSTWGPHSLVQRMGTVILRQLPHLDGDYKIFLFIHPMNFRAGFPDQAAFMKLAAAYERDGVARRVEPLESAVPYLVAADVMLSDHTSLSLYYALLNKPHFYISLTEDLMPGSLIWKFYQGQTPFDPVLPLAVQLDQTIRHFSMERQKESARLLVNGRGEARQRIKAEIASFLLY